jgi:hypothetical protein
MFRKLALAGAMLLAFALGTHVASAAVCPASLLATVQGVNGIAQQTVLEAICALLDSSASGGTTGLSYTDASIASATGASQTVAAASATRKALIIYNPDTTTWWLNPSGEAASANCAGCVELPPRSYWSPRPAPINAVTGIGTATAKLSVKTG